MHVVTGGAYNGKARWVKAFYGLDDKPHTWLSAYNNNVKSLPAIKSNILVVEGIEQCVLNEVENCTDLKREYGSVLIRRLKEWEEQSTERQLIVIGVDISKGIVPTSGIERRWRDLTGWVYQDLVKVSKRVDYIWYGINHQLK